MCRPISSSSSSSSRPVARTETPTHSRPEKFHLKSSPTEETFSTSRINVFGLHLGTLCRLLQDPKYRTKVPGTLSSTVSLFSSRGRQFSTTGFRSYRDFRNPPVQKSERRRGRVPRGSPGEVLRCVLVCTTKVEVTHPRRRSVPSLREETVYHRDSGKYLFKVLVDEYRTVTANTRRTRGGSVNWRDSRTKENLLTLVLMERPNPDRGSNYEHS